MTRGRAHGFTLVEILVAAAVFGIACVGVFAAFRYATAAMLASEDRVRAEWLATEIVEEVRVKDRYEAPAGGGPPAWGCETGEAGDDRTVLDDIDDYDGLAEAPPRDPTGVPRPGLDGWSRRVEVAAVEASDPSQEAPGGGTPLRRIRVVVEREGEPLADVTVLAAGRRPS